MLQEIKNKLLSDPEKIKEILENFGYCNIVIRRTYMHFGRDENSSHKSISIKLIDNDYLMVNDYARNIYKDFFSFIIFQRDVSFKEVISEVKKVLDMQDWSYNNLKPYKVFGGFYDRIRPINKYEESYLDENILNQYLPLGNQRFLRDKISLETQRKYNILYDETSNCIAIPIYNEIGQLIGVKERFNYDVEDGELKYFYSYPCSMSQTLYGYSHNYSLLYGNTVYVFEAEKSVMQCDSYGIYNCVAIGSGSLSLKQAQLIMMLKPTKIIFMHDIGFEIESIKRNIQTIKEYSKFSECEIGYWDFSHRENNGKFSPSDFGKKELEKIMESEIKMIGSDEIV